MENVWKVLVFSIVSFIFLFLTMKILGKKQIAELSFIDYAVGISIGSIAAEWSTETEAPFYHYVIAISVYGLFSLVLDILERKAPFRKFLKGEVLPIIEDGKFNYRNLVKSKLDVEDVLSMARDKDIFDIQDVAYALFEPTGKLSILPKSGKAPATAEDVGAKNPPASPAEYVIVQGKPQYETIRGLKLTIEEIFEHLNIRSKRDLKSVLLASYDEAKKSYCVQRK